MIRFLLPTPFHQATSLVRGGLNNMVENAVKSPRRQRKAKSEKFKLFQEPVYDSIMKDLLIYDNVTACLDDVSYRPYCYDFNVQLQLFCGVLPYPQPCFVLLLTLSATSRLVRILASFLMTALLELLVLTTRLR